MKHSSLCCLATMIVVMNGSLLQAGPPGFNILRQYVDSKQWVTSIAFSPDGKTLASGDWGDTAHLWDVVTGKERAKLPGQPEFGTAVAFSPDGKLVATAATVGVDKIAIQIWDAASGELRFKPESKWSAEAIAFSPDSQTLAIGGDTLQFWNVATGAFREVPIEPAIIDALTFHPDGKIVATSNGHDDEIQLYDVMTGKKVAKLQPQTGAAVFTPNTGNRPPAFSRDGKLLASIGKDATIRIWNWSTRREQIVLRGHTLPVYSVAFSPDGTVLASASQDCTVKLWNLKTGQMIYTSPKTMLPCGNVAYSPDGKMLATGNWSGEIKIWDITPNTLKPPTLATPAKPVVLTHYAEVKSIKFSDDGKKIITSTSERPRSGQVQVWDASTGQTGSEVNLPESLSSNFRVTAASRDLNYLALEPIDRVDDPNRDVVSLYDARSKKIAASFPTPRQFFEPIIQFSPDGKLIAIADQFGVIKIREISSEKETAVLKTGEEGKLSGRSFMAISAEHTLVFSPDSKSIAATFGDQKIRIWDARSGEVQLVIDQASVNLIAFSPDGKWLAGAYGIGAGQIIVWDMASGETQITYPTNGSVPSADGQRVTMHFVKSIAFSPDGKMFASAMGQTVSLWDPTNLQPNTYTVHSSGVNAVAFSPDGKFLTTGSDDKTVRLWKVVAPERQ